MAGIPTIMDYSPPTSGALPANAVGWVARPERSVLLIHDMQQFFLRALPGPLRETVVANTAELLRRCRLFGVPVAYTAQPGDMTEAQRGLLRDFWGPGMRSAPADREVVPELAPAAGDWVFTKWRYSAFFRSGLLSRMRSHGRDQLLLCGVYAHVGVLATALDAFAHDIQPFLVADALGDFSAEEHRLALDYAARRCGSVVPTEEVFA